MEEIWKDIPNYEGLYQASNLGRIKSLERFNYKGHHNLERILKQTKCKNGYYYVALCKDKKVKSIPVHRLIAITFLDNSNNLPCINHIDGNKSNNKISNLEFCTYSHNNKEAYKLGLKPSLKLRQNYYSIKKSKKVNQYDKEHNFIKQWDSINEIVRALKVNRQNVSACCNKKITSSYGYIFEFIDESEVMKNEYD